METFIKGHSFEFQRTLVYKDADTTAIDLTSVVDIVVTFRNPQGRVVLKTFTYSLSEIEIVSPATSGVISIKFNPGDTSGATETTYEAKVVVTFTDAEYDSSTADFAGLDNAFTLIG